MTTVRIQEIFVLYRSYLWVAPGFCGVLVLEPWLKPRVFVAVTATVSVLLFVLAWDRLTTFSHPLLLWDDAERLVQGRHGLTGLERIYRNRGIAFYHVGRFDLAIDDYSKAININPGYSYAYNDRGAALLQVKRYQEAFEDFDTSLHLVPNNMRSLAGRGAALEALGHKDEANESYRAACSLGWRSACAKLM
jgi:tetratricopeptide (TPR) repeat protein